ncbi:MAG TPA: hypothetical protein PKA37_18785, partial [Planctomycetota bacterium]|nr:hypothetical protein [Planctomycetota bacterium]
GATSSPERVARTELRWIDLDLVKPTPKPPVEGQTVEAPLSPLDDLLNRATPHGIPALIYFAADGKTDERDKLEESVFGDSKFALASQFFRMVRVSPGDIKDPEMQKKFTDPSGPVFLIVEADGKQVPILKGWNTTATKLVRAMGGPFQKTFKLDLSAFIAKEERFLDQLDQVQDEIAVKKQELVAALTSDSDSARRKEVTLSGQISELERKLDVLKKEEKEYMEAPLKKVLDPLKDAKKS